MVAKEGTEGREEGRRMKERGGDRGKCPWGGEGGQKTEEEGKEERGTGWEEEREGEERGGGSWGKKQEEERKEGKRTEGKELGWRRPLNVSAG